MPAATLAAQPLPGADVQPRAPGGAPLPLMTDPNLVWQSLQYHQHGLMQVGAADPGHPNHDLFQAVCAGMQQMMEGGPLPAVGLDGLPVPVGALPVARRSPFLDEDGLLTYTPDPLKVRSLGLA